MYNVLLRKTSALTLMLVDFLAVILSLLGAYLMRFDFIIPAEYFRALITLLFISIPIKLVIFYAFGLYRGMYRYTSVWDMINIIKAALTSSLLIIAIIGFLTFFEGVPRSVLFLDFILTILLVSISRISIRLYFTHLDVSQKNREDSSQKTMILLGAGRTGEKIAREILGSYSGEFKIAGFLDDDPAKKGSRLHGIPVLGTINDLPHLSIPFDEILITAPSSAGEEMRRLVEICKSTGKRFKTVPSFSELINHEVSIKSVREVSLMDLLGRDEVKLDLDSIDQFLKGKRVLVTGAGGSIGSELVRQCLGFKPGLVLLLDNSEQNLFDIEQECLESNSPIRVKAILGNIKTKDDLNRIFQEYRPQVILHAAAYKHVPVQELHPWCAVKTNVLGTLNLVELAKIYAVEKFVLVSTDKAVHPINVMGATKRLSERIIQSVDKKEKTIFLAVRFGNVIGSSGSVIPTFQRQIERGGPVTITHPEMTRYFMSIPEAAQLILQAGSLGTGGEVFVLDMGKPIKIRNMAYDLIRLSGLEPEVDIPLIYTGLRPGEKLYEELVTNEEKVKQTEHKKIMIIRDGRSSVPWLIIRKEIEDLLSITDKYDPDAIKQKLKNMMPEYEPQDYFPPLTDVGIQGASIKGQA